MAELFLSNIENLPRDLANRLKKSFPKLILGKTLFVDTIDCNADSCVAIFEGPSAKYNPLAGANRRTIIIQARAKQSSESRSLIWKVFRSLEGSEDNFLVLDNGRHPYTFENTPFKIGKDEKGRITFQFTMYIIYHN